MRSERAQELKRLGVAVVAVGVFTIPIFRSGGRQNLTMFQWIINHTIFGPPVEYVPEEDYIAELRGVTFITRIVST